MVSIPLLLSVLTLAAVALVVACAQDDDAQVPTGSPPPAQSTAGAGVAAATDPAQGEGTPAASPTPTTTATPAATATATRVPTGPITICMAEEPASLYLYGPDSPAARAVRELIYDGPIDTRNFGYQPVILEKIPSLADGDATLEAVTVGEGDLVVDAQGSIVRLRDGIVVRPSGCYADDCAVTFTTGDAGENGQESTAVDTVTMEQLRVDFTLLPDLTWSDGEPLAAQDSVFSYELALDAQIPPRRRTGSQGLAPERLVDPVPRTALYSAVDERTVRWVGLPGYLDPYYKGNFFVPLPEHVLGDLSLEELQEAEVSARLPMGWGPYVLAEWEPGRQIVAERNPNYFRQGPETPYFDQVVFRFAGDDDESLLEDVATGQCDLLTDEALGTEWQRYQEEGLTLHTTPGTVWEHLDFGIDPAPAYSWRPDFFEDARVRQAVAHCVDRQALMETMMAGRSVVPDAYIPPSHPLYAQADLTSYPYDPEEGRRLIREAGWRDTNGDGVAEAYGIEGLEDGTRLIVAFATTTSQLRRQVAEAVAADLAQCGFQVNVTAEPLPPQVFFNPDVSSPIFGRAFDLTAFAWFADALPPCHLYTTEAIPDAASGWSGFNISGFSNEEYDAACAQATNTIPGMDRYLSGHLDALRIFNRELPAIPLFVHLRAAVSGSDIEGMELDPSHPALTWNIEAYRRAP